MSLTKRNPGNYSTVLRRFVFTACMAGLFADCAGAVTRIFPSPDAPCNATLQSCVDGSGAGDVIQILPGAYPAATTVIRSSLTIVGTGSRDATIVNGNIFVDGSNNGLTVSFQKLTFDRLTAVYGAGQMGFALSMVDNHLRGEAEQRTVDVLPSGGFPPAPYGPISVTLENNAIEAGRPTSTGSSCESGIRLIFDGAFDAKIVANHVDVLTTSAGILRTICEGIRVGSVDSPGTVVVDRNIVRGYAFEHGLLLLAYGSGALTADVVNNTISGFDNGPSFSVASVSFGTITSASAVDARVVNNTLVRATHGIAANVAGPGTLTGGAYNNIIAHTSAEGLLTAAVSASFDNAFNLFFDSSLGQVTPGPGTLFVDPLFVSPAAGDWRIQRASVAVDAGSSARLGPSFVLDAAEARRRVGVIDIGSYEVSAGLLDVDESGKPTQVDASTDALLILRRRIGFGGTSLTAGAMAITATRTPDEVASYIDGLGLILDVDGDGNVAAMVDGLLILRYLLGLRGEALVQGTGVSISSATAIESRIQSLLL